MSRIEPSVIEALKAVVGGSGFLQTEHDKAPYLREWRDIYLGRSPLILRPANTGEVSAIVRICHAAGVALVPQGGNTSLCGGSVPDETGNEIVLSLGRMNKVLSIDRLNNTITLQAGCVLERVHDAAAEADRLFPLRIGSQGSCQIGGNLSTNAGGTAVLRYGNMRDLVLGLEVVLADGRVWNGLRGLRKDNTGYDLKHLFIGAEGTLGIITAAVLKLFPIPGDVQTALAGIPGPAAATSLLEIARARAGDQVTAFEIIPRLGIDLVTRHIPGCTDPMTGPHPWYLLIELSAAGAGALRDALLSVLEDGLDQGLVHDAVLAETVAQAEAFWKLRDSLSEAQKLEGGSIKHDVSVPISRIDEFIAAADQAVDLIVPGFRSVAFGHIGDGNIHYNPLKPAGGGDADFLGHWSQVNRVVHDLVDRFGGSISAEHGLGRLKCQEIKRYKGAVEIDLMATVKAALDPTGILNPGKVVAPRD